MADEPQLSPNFIHVVRTTQQIHLQLSQMADQKASMLMAATFVIFTITISQAHGALPPLPLAILGGFAFLSAVLAMSAVMPSIGGGKAVGDTPLNLLFFGSFTELSEADYIARLRAEVGSDRAVLEVMARDIYQNGQVLKRKKYRLLGWAYRVFLVGLVLSFGAFVWSMVRFG
ncbi:MAG: Pycsar system effector family protein [Pseudomonadota bacterium]